MMKYTMITAAVAALSLTLFAQPALAAQSVGQLPLYPRGRPAHGMEDITRAALAQGVPYQLTTSDSVHVVDLWYQSNTQKSCSRVAAGGAVQYKCPGGSIVIQVHGETLISYVPAFPHF
jgi:hypothetical protein